MSLRLKSVTSRCTYPVSMKLFVSQWDEHEAVSGHAASVAEAASGASGTGSAANVDMYVPADFFHWDTLRKTEMFQGLLRQVRKAVKTNMERPCLSYHTTQSCRRDRALVESLNSCGMDTAIPSPSGPSGHVYVHVHLSHSFYDDDSWGFTTILQHVPS